MHRHLYYYRINSVKFVVEYLMLFILFLILCHPPGMLLHLTSPPCGGGNAVGNRFPMAWSGSPLPLRQPPKIDAPRIPVRSPDVDTEFVEVGALYWRR